jgi:hypothetical protein
MDMYTHYEQGLEQLLAQMGRDYPRYADALILQQRIGENIMRVRQYDEDATGKGERTQVIEQLNALALAVLGVSFNDLCQPVAADGFSSSQSSIPSRHYDWGEAPDVSTFSGREAELETLSRWVINDRCTDLQSPCAVIHTVVCRQWCITIVSHVACDVSLRQGMQPVTAKQTSHRRSCPEHSPFSILHYLESHVKARKFPGSAGSLPAPMQASRLRSQVFWPKLATLT